MEEIWKVIREGYYEVSNLGNVRSIDRYVDNFAGTKSFRKGLVLSFTVTPKGYLAVNFRIENQKENPVVHRLVAIAFLENPLNLPQVNHIDGDKWNNEVTNLEWCTGSGNMYHAYATGLASKVGTRNTACKLTEADVLEIRSLQGAQSGKILGDKYGINKSAIFKIWNRETWSHI